MKQPLRIATRSSRLALWQAEHVAALIRSTHPEIEVQLVEVSTLGDRDLSGPLHGLGTWGVFTREVQQAVFSHQADLAVHSLKDLPTEPVEGLTLACVPARGEIFDVLVLPHHTTTVTKKFHELPLGARIGTGSIRRRAQLLHARPDLKFLDIRGNVETRLRKLDEGQYDALVLAEAGLTRLGLGERITEKIGPPLIYPAVGQGALGIECRIDDHETRSLLESISDPGTWQAVRAERKLLKELRGGCHAPVGILTEVRDSMLSLVAVVHSVDGRERIRAESESPRESPEELGELVAHLLRQQGADELIESSRIYHQTKPD